jgi:hypothetical protein
LAESKKQFPADDCRSAARWLLDDKDVTAGPGSGRCLTGYQLRSVMELAMARELHKAGSPRIGQQDLLGPE